MPLVHSLSLLCFDVPFLYSYQFYFYQKVGSNPAELNVLNAITTIAFTHLDVMYYGMSKRPDMESNNANLL